MSRFRTLMRRVAGTSPLVPALTYTATVWLANVFATFAPQAIALNAFTILLWLATGLLFLVLVVWFRDDDWLAAGFLLGLTLLLSSWTADVVTQIITHRSLVPALFAAPGMLFGVFLRGLVSVPALGGLVAFLRWVTRHKPIAAPRAETSNTPSHRRFGWPAR